MSLPTFAHLSPLTSDTQPLTALNIKLSDDLLNRIAYSTKTKLVVKDGKPSLKIINSDGSELSYDCNLQDENSTIQLYANNYLNNENDDLDPSNSFRIVGTVLSKITVFTNGLRRSKSGTESKIPTSSGSSSNSSSTSVSPRDSSSSSSSSSSTINNNTSSLLKRPKPLVAVNALRDINSWENRILHLMALGPNTIIGIKNRCKINSYSHVESIVKKLGDIIINNNKAFKEDKYFDNSHLPVDFEPPKVVLDNSEDNYYILKDGYYQHLKIWDWRYTEDQREIILANMNRAFDRLNLTNNDPRRQLLTNPKILAESLKEKELLKESLKRKEYEEAQRKKELIKQQTAKQLESKEKERKLRSNNVAITSINNTTTSNIIANTTTNNNSKKPTIHETKKPVIHETKKPVNHETKKPVNHEIKKSVSPEVKAKPTIKSKSEIIPQGSLIELGKGVVRPPIPEMTKTVRSPKKRSLSDDSVENVSIKKTKTINKNSPIKSNNIVLETEDFSLIKFKKVAHTSSMGAASSAESGAPSDQMFELAARFKKKYEEYSQLYKYIKEKSGDSKKIDKNLEDCVKRVITLHNELTIWKKKLWNLDDSSKKIHSRQSSKSKTNPSTASTTTLPKRLKPINKPSPLVHNKRQSMGAKKAVPKSTTTNRRTSRLFK